MHRSRYTNLQEERIYPSSLSSLVGYTLITEIKLPICNVKLSRGETTQDISKGIAHSRIALFNPRILSWTLLSVHFLGSIAPTRKVRIVILPKACLHILGLVN